MNELKNGIDAMVKASTTDKADVKPIAPTPAPSQKAKLTPGEQGEIAAMQDAKKEFIKKLNQTKMTPGEEGVLAARQEAKAKSQPNQKPTYKDLSDDDLYEDLADNQHWYGNAKDVNQVADTMSKRLGVSPERALDFAKKNWKGEKTWFSVDPDELDELINHAHNTYDQEFRGDKAAEGFIKDYEFGNMDENFDPSKDYKLRDDEKAYIKKRFNELRPTQPKKPISIEELNRRTMRSSEMGKPTPSKENQPFDFAKAGEEDITLDELRERLGRHPTNEEYKQFIYPKMLKFYDEWKADGYSDEDVREEMKDAFGYDDLIEKVFQEKAPKQEQPTKNDEDIYNDNFYGIKEALESGKIDLNKYKVRDRFGNIELDVKNPNLIKEVMALYPGLKDPGDVQYFIDDVYGVYGEDLFEQSEENKNYPVNSKLRDRVKAERINLNLLKSKLNNYKTTGEVRAIVDEDVGNFNGLSNGEIIDLLDALGYDYGVKRENGKSKIIYVPKK